jgi:hypothetical protein
LFFGHRVGFDRQIWRGTIAKKQRCYQTECGKTAINEELAHNRDSSTERPSGLNRESRPFHGGRLYHFVVAVWREK